MTETTSAPTETTESVEEFAARASRWLAENMPRIDPANPPEADRGEDAPWQRARELQKKLYEGGFAGICFPREYGGLGLPIAYQKAFDNEARGYEMPMILTRRHSRSAPRRSSIPARKSRSVNIFRPRCAATKCSFSCCRNPVADRIWPVSSPGPTASATNG